MVPLMEVHPSLDDSCQLCSERLCPRSTSLLLTVHLLFHIAFPLGISKVTCLAGLRIFLPHCPPHSFTTRGPWPVNWVPAAVLSCLAHCSGLTGLPVLILSSLYGSQHHIQKDFPNSLSDHGSPPSKAFSDFPEGKVQSLYLVSARPCGLGACPLPDFTSPHSVFAPSASVLRTASPFLAQIATLLLRDYTLNSSAFLAQTLSSVHSDANPIREPFSDCPKIASLVSPCP